MSKLYPESLFQYSNDSKIAVKKVIDKSSGWTEEMIKTSLIAKMDTLIEDVKAKRITKPFSIYLVGGPGNGKTAAAEYFVNKLYREVLGRECECREVGNGRFQYDLPLSENMTGVVLVEDATSASNTKESIKTIIKEANETVLTPLDSRDIYICCVNRGILSDCARVNDSSAGVTFLEKLSHTVAVSTDSVPVWPLTGNKLYTNDAIYDSIYVWPMDIESLLDAYIYGGYDKTPAACILSKMLTQDMTHCEQCVNKDFCPFFFNYQTLTESENRSNLIQVLYEFEISMGKKLLFRDLFSIYNVLLVGDEGEYKSEPLANIGQRPKKITPCQWVAQNVAHIQSADKRSLAAAFNLISKQYHYVLFGNWREFREIDSSLKESSIIFEKLTALFDVISKKDRNRRKTSTAWELIHHRFSQTMDVAFVEERQELERLEEAFSSSFRLGFDALKRLKLKPLSTIESYLFQTLNDQEIEIETKDFLVGSKEEHLALRYLKAIKIFGCRLAKRTMGIDLPAVYNGTEIEEYCSLLQGKGSSNEIKEIRNALQEVIFGNGAISMMHNFAQKDPSDVKFYLLPEKLKIKHTPVKGLVNETNKVISNTLILRIEKANIDIPISFELYLALKQFGKGMSIAALPEQVFAQLNILSSKVLGWLIHQDDEDLRFSFCEQNGKIFEKIDNDLVAEEL